MFGVDPLTAWLIERLADAGYKKLTTLVRGSDQDRALRKAVEAAVQATAEEIGGPDKQEVDRLAKLINGAFGKSAPVKLLPRQLTRLERLYAAIAQQLSVLDDGEQPPPGLLGVPIGAVAQSLAGHLVEEIKNLGTLGGPLTPLAAQLNDDQTHLKVEEVKALLAQMLGELRDRPAPAGSAEGPVGWPLAEVSNPFTLEVHRPVEPDFLQAGLPVLPDYWPRGHDAVLAEVVSAAAAGASGIAVLVGGSSTGKTRACWEALELLRGVEPGWRLWHPIDSKGALAGLPDVGPRTVVWLNEAQRFLDTAGGAGERVAAELRALLRERDRGPVLVLATLRLEFWPELAARPPGDVDPHAQARELLTGHDIPVPDKFDDDQLQELQESADPRLAEAAAASRNGEVIQYLAGAPELLDRYRTASPAARALIDAAIDAVRLGMRGTLPRAFLEVAAPGYLTDTEWNLLDGNWLEEGLAYTKKAAKGVPGPLTPIRPRPAPGAPAAPGDGLAWQLADYLDQYGRRARREEIPPEAFWAAAASYANPADLASLGDAAEARGLYRDAARLHKQASGHGYPTAGIRLVRLLHTVHPGDQRPGRWAAARTSPDNPADVGSLLFALREAGATAEVTTLASRAAARTSLDDPAAVGRLLRALREAGATDQFTALLDRAAAQVSLDDPANVALLLDVLREAGATGEVTTLASRAAARTSLDDPAAVGRLLRALREAGATDQFTALLDRAAVQVSLDNADKVGWMLLSLREAAASGQVTTLLDRAAAQVSLDDPAGVALLLMILREAGATGQVTALLDRDPAAQVSLKGQVGLAFLLGELRWAGATGQVTTLLDRIAAHISLDDLGTLAEMLVKVSQEGGFDQVNTLLDRIAAHISPDQPGTQAGMLIEPGVAGSVGQITTLLARAAAGASLDDPHSVALLLSALRIAALDHVTTLLDRDPATHVSLDDPRSVTDLLATLSSLEAVGIPGAAGQFTALASRAAAGASLDDPHSVALLLGALFRAAAAGDFATLASRAAAGASLDGPSGVADLLRVLSAPSELVMVQATKLIERLPAAGMFQLFREQEGHAEKFRFGREADGRPAKPWAWTDLG